MSDVNSTTARWDSFGPVGAQPTFSEPSDYKIGQHVVFHHFDGKDYEAVITDVWGPGSDVPNRWLVHLDVGDLGRLYNITESSRENTQLEGTFSLKPASDPTTKDDALVKNQRPGTVLPTRADQNPRPQVAEHGSRRGKDFDWASYAPSGVPQQSAAVADPLQEVRDDQIHREQDAENLGDPGLDTPANYMTDQRTEQGDPYPPASDSPVGTTRSADDEHVVDKKSKTK